MDPLQSIFLVLAAMMIYFFVRTCGEICTRFFWVLFIGASLIIAFITQDAMLLIFAAASILFAWDDWANFEKK